MTVIGVTGSMGSGKTTVSEMFKDIGAKVVDADKIALSALNDAHIVKKLGKAFGSDVISRGRIDKKKLAASAFENKKSAKTLCGITHPYILSIIKKIISKKTKKPLIIDAALLIESGLYRAVDKVCLVKNIRDKQIKRIVKRGFTEKDIKKRLKTQMPLYKKMKYADFVIDNSGTKKNTKQQIEKILKKITKEV